MSSKYKHQDLPVVLHNEKRGLLTFDNGTLEVLQLSKDGRPPKCLLTCTTRNLLLARLAPGRPEVQRRLDLHVLIAKGSHLRLSKMHVLVEPINEPEAMEWVEEAMRLAYTGSKPSRRVLILVNPVGGKGKAKAVVKDSVLPMLEAAGCVVTLIETTHRLHAEEIARELDLDSGLDVIASASGDGLVYEILNGLASHKNARKALRIPVAPIPTGSANALCINLFGPKDTFNIELACLNIIKGLTMPIDLCSVHLLPSQTRRWSFLATATGLMVDLDIGTESIRWLGDSRFVLGFLRGIVTNKKEKTRLRMKVVEDDKVEMARRARQWAGEKRGKKVGGGVDPLARGGALKGMGVGRNEGDNGERGSKGGAGDEANETVKRDGSLNGDKRGKNEHGHEGGQEDESEKEGPIPDSKPLEPDSTWLTIESGGTGRGDESGNSSPAVKRDAKGGAWVDGQGIMYTYAGMMPWVARDLMQWPVAISGQGVIDIVVQSIVPRATLVGAITGAEKGEAYWMECQHYYKVSAFTCENMDKGNSAQFTIDGEAFPYDSFHVEVHPRMASVLSLDGHFFLSDFLKKQDLKE